MAVVAVLALSAPVSAQTDKTTVRKTAIDDLVEELRKELSLTADQQARVRQVLDTHKQAMDNWNRQYGSKQRELRKKLAEARESRDREAMRGIREEMQKLTTPRRALVENLEKEIGEIVGAEQKRKAMSIITRFLERMRRNPLTPVIEALEKMELSEAQKARIEGIIKDANAKIAKSDRPAVKEKTAADAIAVIRKLLTDEQKAQLDAAIRQDKLRRMGLGWLVGLEPTDEQVVRVQAIMEEARRKLEKTETRRERIEIWQETLETIRREVLTDEQRKKADELRRGFRGRRGRSGGPGGGADQPRE